MATDKYRDAIRRKQDQWKRRQRKREIVGQHRAGTEPYPTDDAMRRNMERDIERWRQREPERDPAPGELTPLSWETTLLLAEAIYKTAVWDAQRYLAIVRGTPGTEAIVLPAKEEELEGLLSRLTHAERLGYLPGFVMVRRLERFWLHFYYAAFLRNLFPATVVRDHVADAIAWKKAEEGDGVRRTKLMLGQGEMLFEWLVFGNAPEDKQTAYMNSSFVERVKALGNVPLESLDEMLQRDRAEPEHN